MLFVLKIPNTSKGKGHELRINKGSWIAYRIIFIPGRIGEKRSLLVSFHTSSQTQAKARGINN